jgi:hypothetical protein
VTLCGQERKLMKMYIYCTTNTFMLTQTYFVFIINSTFKSVYHKNKWASCTIEKWCCYDSWIITNEMNVWNGRLNLQECYL